jgi:hypothetical protein
MQWNEKRLLYILYPKFHANSPFSYETQLEARRDDVVAEHVTIELTHANTYMWRQKHVYSITCLKATALTEPTASIQHSLLPADAKYNRVSDKRNISPNTILQKFL